MSSPQEHSSSIILCPKWNFLKFEDIEKGENRNDLQNFTDFTLFSNHVFHTSHTTWKQKIKWPDLMV